LTRLNMETK